MWLKRNGNEFTVKITSFFNVVLRLALAIVTLEVRGENVTGEQRYQLSDKFESRPESCGGSPQRENSGDGRGN